jgi:ADP-ribose pyrophosphatase YjhB (NUDIX family)
LYLLAQRSRWVESGQTWGIPGGAMKAGETPRAAARRETTEEIFPVPRYRVTGVEVQDCGGWLFHIVCADVTRPFIAYMASETDTTGWFTLEQMNALPLIPGFRRWVDEHSAHPAPMLRNSGERRPASLLQGHAARRRSVSSSVSSMAAT